MERKKTVSPHLDKVISLLNCVRVISAKLYGGFCKGQIPRYSSETVVSKSKIDEWRGYGRSKLDALAGTLYGKHKHNMLAHSRWPYKCFINDELPAIHPGIFSADASLFNDARHMHAWPTKFWKSDLEIADRKTQVSNIAESIDGNMDSPSATHFYNQFFYNNVFDTNEDLGNFLETLGSVTIPPNDRFRQHFVQKYLIEGARMDKHMKDNIHLLYLFEVNDKLVNFYTKVYCAQELNSKETTETLTDLWLHKAAYVVSRIYIDIVSSLSGTMQLSENDLFYNCNCEYISSSWLSLKSNMFQYGVSPCARKRIIFVGIPNDNDLHQLYSSYIRDKYDVLFI
jgi:hypothetical protein